MRTIQLNTQINIQSMMNMTDEEFKANVLKLLKDIKDEIFKLNYDTNLIWRKD